MRILVLAGGYDQIGLITELKTRGHEVILADYFSNPPAKKVADKHYQVSTLDEDAVKEVAIKENVDLITTACTDQALLTVAKVSELLGLPTYISYEKGLEVTNKKYMKEMFVKIGVPTAQSVILEDETSVSEKIQNLKFPLVVKPCDCNSSKGVKRVDSDKQLMLAIKEAFALSRSHLVIVEEYIVGEEVSIDVWVDAQGAKVLSVSQTEKIPNDEGNFTIFKSKYPVNMTDVVYKKIQDIASLIATGFELKNCPILIQAIINDTNAYVIEFSARMGGGTKYKLIEYMSGVNIMEKYVNRVLGDEMQIITPIPSEKSIELNYVYAKNGVFKELVNFEECKKDQSIVDYYQYKEAGAVVEKASTSSDRIVGFLLIDKDNESLSKKRKLVVDKVDVLNDKHESMMLKSVFGEDDLNE